MMTTILWILLGLFIWTVAGVLYFLGRLGEKHRRLTKMQNIVEHVLMAPVMPIAMVIGFFANRKR